MTEKGTIWQWITCQLLSNYIWIKGLKKSNFGSLIYTVNGVFIIIGYNLLRTIYDDNFDPDVEVQIDGNMFQGMRGRVMFSKVSRADRFVRAGEGQGLFPPPAFCRFRSTPLLDRLSSNLSTFLMVLYILFHLLYIERKNEGFEIFDIL